MEAAELIGVIESTGAHFSDVAASADLGRAVEACPGWDIEHLVGHLGGVYEWVHEILSTGGPVDRSLAEPAPAGSAVVPWFRAAHLRLVEDLRDRDPEEPAWVFRRRAPQTVGWWCRRQAMETAVHHFDIEAAAGLDPSAVDPAVAVEGIDEMLSEMLPPFLRKEKPVGVKGTLHLHATDEGVDGEWWIDLDSETVAPERRHAKADTAVRGPASGLFFWLWNRQTPEQADLQVFGSDEVIASLREVMF